MIWLAAIYVVVYFVVFFEYHEGDDSFQPHIMAITWPLWVPFAALAILFTIGLMITAKSSPIDGEGMPPSGDLF